MDIVSYLLGKQSSGGGGGTPTKGFTIDAWSNDGFPTAITTYGYTTIDPYMFYVNNSTSCFKNLESVSFNSGIVEIGGSCFSGCIQLRDVAIPNTTTYIGNNVFPGCINLVITELAGVETIGTASFRGCSSIKKISMPSLVSATNSSVNNGTFSNCTDLKKVWIGSSITNLGRYTFYNCSNMQNIYINLPRATVETMTNYPYAFSNNTFSTDIIICNDDVNFITLEQFDALVVN